MLCTPLNAYPCSADGDTSANLRALEQAILAFPQSGKQALGPELIRRDCFLTNPPITEDILIAVLRSKDKVSPHARLLATRISTAFPSDEVKSLVREILKSHSEDTAVLDAAAQSAALWGDSSFIPLILQGWRNAQDGHLKLDLIGALLTFGSPASNALREIFDEDTKFEDRHHILYYLVMENVPWAVSEFEKPRYGANGWDLRRQAFWERELRLRALRLAKQGKALDRAQSRDVPPIPTGWKAPYDK